MKRLLQLTVIALVVLVIPETMMAQQDSVVSHRLGFAVQGGGSFLFFSAADAKSDLGYGGGVNLLYELNYRHLLFRTGVGCDISFNRTHLTPQTVAREIQEYAGMVYHYTFNPYRELQRYATAYVPVYLGGVFGGFHFMVGAKAGFYPFLGQSQVTTERAVQAIDPDVVGPMENLYTHYMTNGTQTATQKLAFRQFNLMVSAELGLAFDRWMKEGAKSHVYLSLFADYGVLNINDAPANRMQDEMIAIRTPEEMSVSSMLGNPQWQQERLNNLMAGLKLTCTFDVSASRGKAKKQPVPQEEPTLESKPESVPVLTQGSDTVTKVVVIPVPVPLLLPIPVPGSVKADEAPAVTTDSIPLSPAPSSLDGWNEVTNAVGRTFVLDNLYFATAQHVILPSSEPALHVLLEMMQYYPQRRILITGHTDDVGKYGYNWRLSQRRAISVKRWLYEHGIDPIRIETDGKGETRPCVPNNSPRNRQLNRRVEILILQ